MSRTRSGLPYSRLGRLRATGQVTGRVGPVLRYKPSDEIQIRFSRGPITGNPRCIVQ